MSDSKAFGDFSGEKEDYPAFKEDIAAYKTINYEAEFKGYEGAVRPKGRDRISFLLPTTPGVLESALVLRSAAAARDLDRRSAALFAATSTQPPLLFFCARPAPKIYAAYQGPASILFRFTRRTQALLTSFRVAALFPFTGIVHR